MTETEFEQQIRAMSVRLAESSPIAPTFDEIHERAEQMATQVEVAPDPVAATPGSSANAIWRKALALVGLGVVAGGGAFALGALTADDGAQSPQAAVEDFLEAASAEDAIGLGETLVGTERDLVLDNLDPILAQLERLEITDSSADPGDVGGLEVTADVESLRLQESPLSDNVTRVRILDGDIRVDADFTSMPLGAAVEREGPLENPDPIDLLTDVFGGQADVVAIEDADGWHVSLFYTLAEYLRADQGLPNTDLGGGPAPVGAESPDALVEDLLDGLVAGDFARLLTLADPVEGAVLYDYWPVFEPELAEGLADALASGPHGEVRSYETEISGEGAERVVSLTAWDYTASLYGDGFEESQQFDGECFTATYTDDYGPDETSEGCVGQPVTIDGESRTPQRYGMTDLAIVERDGRWYLRPGQTVIESWLSGAAMSESGIDDRYLAGVLFSAYPSPPGWSPADRYGSPEHDGTGMVGQTTTGCEALVQVGSDTLAECMTASFGATVTGADVDACRAVIDPAQAVEPGELYWQIEGCVAQSLFPPSPMDVLISELLSCPGSAEVSSGSELDPATQQALVDCGTAIFEAGSVPPEVLASMAACLGVTEDELPSVTDLEALIDCGYQALTDAPVDDPGQVGPGVVPTTVVSDTD